MQYDSRHIDRRPAWERRKINTAGYCSVSVGALDPSVTTGIIDQIRTALENVVRNAIRHTKVNSEVEITVRKQGEPPNGAAVVTVRDHGSGVADSDLQKIFQPFYRASSEGSNSEGSGRG